MTTTISGSTGVTFPVQAGSTSQTQSSAGKVLQVVQTSSATQQTINTTSFTELSSLNTSITPTSTTSKILVVININSGNTNDEFPGYKLFRGATWIAQGTTTGSGTAVSFGGGVIGSSVTDATVYMTNTSFTYLDSPTTTSPITYSVQVSPMRSGARSYSLNRAVTINDSNQLTAVSTITLYEVAA